MQGVLKLVRFKPAAEASTTLTQEELRSLVLEGAQYFRGKHKTMLANLMDLEAISVDDVMTPRSQIHALDLSEKPALLRQQLATSYHTRLPVYEGSLDNIIGVLPVKSVVHVLAGGDLDAERLRTLLRPPYFVPLGTPLLTQLQQFQTDRQRIGLVVDEYGELQGLVTIEDIIEEIIGEFTTQAPGGGRELPPGGRRQRHRRRHGSPAQPQPAPRDAVRAGRPQDPQRPDRRTSGGNTRRRHEFRGRGPARRNPADPGSRREGRQARPPGGAQHGAFTNPG